MDFKNRISDSGDAKMIKPMMLVSMVPSPVMEDIQETDANDIQVKVLKITLHENLH